MQVLRTPDDRFANLPDYPFEPNDVEVQTAGQQPKPKKMKKSA